MRRSNRIAGTGPARHLQISTDHGEGDARGLARLAVGGWFGIGQTGGQGERLGLMCLKWTRRGEQLQRSDEPTDFTSLLGLWNSRLR